MALVISNTDSGSERSPGVQKPGKSAWRRLLLMYAVHIERRQLRTISDEMLRDAGITRQQAMDECNRKFTDIPDQRF